MEKFTYVRPIVRISSAVMICGAMVKYFEVVVIMAVNVWQQRQIEAGEIQKIKIVATVEIKKVFS